jgi:type I restriction enzyme S subunit
VRGITTHDLLSLALCYPDKSEQSRIAAVLDTVDEAIAKTEAVIAKLKQVRTGLLHDLLTHGLDENGQLRDPIAHPKQFQDSSLGSIPVQWELRALKECLLRSPQNGIYKPAGAIGRGTILIGQTSITEDRSIDLAFARRAEISPEEQDRYGLREGDILMSRVFATLEGVGQPALVPPLLEPAVFESNMMCLRVNPEIIASPLLFHWLMSARIRREVVSCVNLSNQASVNQQGLNSLPVVVPAPPEQRRILDVIRVQDQSVQAESIELRKLQLLKSGLMSDLLTGRVRVPEEVAVAP